MSNKLANKISDAGLFFNQVMSLVVSNLKVRYRGTIAGLIWVLMHPTILLIVQTVVFSTVLKIPIKSYLPYLFSGFLPWIFISQTVDMGTTQHKYFSASIRAFGVHPVVVTAALTIENLTTLLFMLFLYSTFSAAFFEFNYLTFLCWIISCVPLALAVFSLTYSVAIMHSKFKDIKFITSFALSVLFFLSPIFYSIEQVPVDQKIYFKLNPFYHLLLPFQTATMDIIILEWFANYSTAFLVALIFLSICWSIWRVNKKDIYLYL